MSLNKKKTLRLSAAFMLALTITYGTDMFSPPETSARQDIPALSAAPHPYKGAQLIKHAAKGNLADVKKLLQENIGIDNVQNMAFIQAAANGHADIAVLLLQHDASIHFRQDQALRVAAENGHTKTVEALLDHGADIHTHSNYALINAAANGHKDTVELLVNKRADIHIHHELPLQYAAIFGHKEIVDFLMERGSDPRLIRDIIKWVEENGHTEIKNALKQRIWELERKQKPASLKPPIA